jgi:hypothetical protein
MLAGCLPQESYHSARLDAETWNRQSWCDFLVAKRLRAFPGTAHLQSFSLALSYKIIFMKKM